ncbi:unnamed protein product, partial [Phaeothamnion confervicola]
SLLGEHDAADRHLRALGFTIKLSRSVWDACKAPPWADCDGRGGNGSGGDGGGGGGSGVAEVAAAAPSVVLLDGALHATPLRNLQAVFAPTSPFWSEHSYPTPGFFSYHYRLA